MNDVVELEGIISVGEALYVKRIVLFMDPKFRNQNVKVASNQKSECKVSCFFYLVADDGDADDHLSSPFADLEIPKWLEIHLLMGRAL